MTGIADLEAKGRGKDTRLLHITDDELRGLKSLAVAHGKKLTRNPETGLYEAGIFGDIYGTIRPAIPMLGGAVASYFGGPWAGAAAGAALGAATGNKKNGLLMNAGLGALGGWGGASLMESFMAAGLSEVTAEQLVAQMSPEALSAQSAQAQEAALYSPLREQAQATAGLSERMKLTGAVPGGDMVPANFMNYQSPPPLAPGQKFDASMQGVKGMFNNSWDKNKQFLQNNTMPLTAAGMSIYGNTGGNQNNDAPQAGSSAPLPGYNYTPPRWNPATGRYETGQQGFSPMAAGGLAGLAGGGSAQQPRMIKGPGDGLSDSVPAVIEGGQKAALADSEFVVSADVVSALGGGSTDAGARRLYQMMDRVRKQAHGTKKQIKKVSNRALPA